MIPLALKRLLMTAGFVAIGGLVLALAFFTLSRVWPRPDPLPATIARADEKTAQRSAETVAREVEARNRDATVNIDVTTKDIRDAFSTMPAADAQPRALPAAPVDRLRDRLNQSIARANRAAGPADTPD